MNEQGFSPVFDAHCDTATRIFTDDGFDMGKRNEGGHIDIPRMREGGLNAQLFAVYTDPNYPERLWEERTIDSIRLFRRAVEENGEEIELALGADHIRRVVNKGKIAAMIGVEGGHVVSSLDVLEKLYGLGMRCLTVTWNNTNAMADSSEDEERWGGLSGFGREVISEMDRMGIIIDCSHVSRGAFFEILDCSANPVILSHSCVRAICDIPRNADDDQIRAIAENGGVVCINYFPAFLDEKSHRDIMKVWGVYKERKRILSREYGGDPARAGGELFPAAMRKLAKLQMPGISAVVDHIDHAVGVAGIDHVGIGSDFDGIPLTPSGLEDVTALPNLTCELRKRGYSAEDAAKVMGGNLFRVVRGVCGGASKE